MKQKNSCNNGHPLITWKIGINTKDSACPVCHKKTKKIKQNEKEIN